ncbi:hypothetical protein HYV79_03290 [Candidatus Woesearchaeota archaeon]|nr:hypothetical protein [Candidatus Woesearchaeota archaeon]
MKCRMCNYEWNPRVKDPKACPSCKYRFDYEFAKKKRQEVLNQIRIFKQQMRRQVLKL